jgi:hypothetical protein
MRPDGLQENFYFGGGATETSFTLVTFILLCLGVILVLALPRKRILLPFFAIGLLVPGSQVLVVPGMHLAVYRLMLLAIWLRIIFGKWVLRNDTYSFAMNALDKVFIAWALSNAIMYSILWQEVAALINRLGFLSISLGVYFMLRFIIRDRDDVIFAIRSLAFATIPVAVAMIYEHFTGQNLISFLLGAGQQLADIRNDRVRAQGPFAHAIVAGTFGAMLIPLFIGLWREGKGNRLRASLGLICSGLISVTSASSTPVMTCIAAIVGFCFWPLRHRMRPLRWAFLMSLVVLQIVMKAPVWFLINRVSGFIGGTGWHRAELIDQFIWRFPEWALIGTQNNADWGLDMWDAINAYVRAGVEGGLLTFILFLSVIVMAYKRLGQARAIAEQLDPWNEFFLWSFAVSLFCNCIAFFGIIYFDQSAVAWYCLLVMISLMTSQYLLEPSSATELVSPAETRPFRPAPLQAYRAFRNADRTSQFSKMLNRLRYSRKTTANPFRAHVKEG